MNSWLLLADAIALVHAGYVLFVVLGMVLICLGGGLGWRFVRNFWFRVVHFSAIGVVAVEALMGLPCPLTLVEEWLRIEGGQMGYGSDFLVYWAHHLLYPEAIPDGLFDVLHVLCAILVIGLWVLIPPRRKRSAQAVPTRPMDRYATAS